MNAGDISKQHRPNLKRCTNEQTKDFIQYTVAQKSFAQCAVSHTDTIATGLRTVKEHQSGKPQALLRAVGLQHRWDFPESSPLTTQTHTNTHPNILLSDSSHEI